MTNRVGTHLLIRPPTLRHYFGAAFLVFLLAQVGRSQSSTDGLTPPSLTPGSPAGSYSLTDFENVNLFNGNLNFHLPLVKIGGRGAAQTALVLKVETRWRIEENAVGGGGTFFYPTYNWWTGAPTPGYGPGSLTARIEIQGDSSCATHPFGSYQSLLRFTFTAADGTEYELRDKQTNGQPLSATACLQIPSRGTEFVTADGTSTLFVSNNNIFDNGGGGVAGYLTLRDGTRYKINDNGFVSEMRDRNGNKVQYTYDTNNRVITVSDSIGRAVNIVYDQQQSPYGLHDKITYTGVDSGQRIVRVSRAFLSTVLRSPFLPQSTYALFPELTGSSQQGSFDTYVVSAVWLPNGKSYSLLYNSYGELARVVLPTGGAIEYDWDAGVEPPLIQGASHSGVWSPNIYRRVIERRTYPNGGTSSPYESRSVYSHQEYLDTNYNWADRGYVSVDQYGSGGTFLSRMKHYFYGYGSYAPFNPFSGSGVFYTPWRFGKEYQTLALDSSGNGTLRKATNTWDQEAVTWWVGASNNAPPNDPHIASTETTLADVSPNKVNKRTFFYSEDGFNNQIAVEEYDYGSSAPPTHAIRRTETDYVSTNAYTKKEIHLVSLPSEQRVYALDSSGAKIEPPVAKTEFFYDQSTLVTRTGIVGLDPDFGSTNRGNLTTTTRWVDDVGISATSEFDVAGNVVSVTDPFGHQTTIGYTDSFSDLTNHQTFAFATSSKSAIPDTGSDPNIRHGSNAQFTASAIYDYNSGLPSSFTDANGKTTTYQFLDSLDRLTGITRPAGGGSTSYDYGDNAGNLFVHSLNDLDIIGVNTRRMEGYQYFDGLGRSTRSFTYDGSASTPWIVTDAYYDGASRVVSTSNPYRVASVSGSVPSCVTCTTTGYDILGRVHTVSVPDGSTATTEYSNNSITTTDPANKKRSATNDGLGRLVSVAENPGGSPSYTTSYTYDLLNNLRKVTQGSQSRFFYYDALSRLRRERNPEQGVNDSLTALTDPVTQNAQWSVEYQYNDNVHLTKKIDPRNISVTLGYDALNRPITRTYSDSTPPVDYIYDGARVPNGIANSKGRLTSVLTSSPFVSSYTYDSFDDMGRVLHTTQTIESNPSYEMSYQYNLAGALTSETYPSTKVYATSYDIAGRIAGVSGPNSKVYAELFTYSPHGGVAQMKLGSGLWEHANFNDRLQPTEIGIGTGQSGTASIDRLKLSLDYGTTDNNGNVTSQTVTVPTISSVSGTILTQCYAYDEFNRLKTAEEKNGAACSGAVVWTQKFIYDQQGNRRFDNGTTIPVGFPNPTINTANDNRINSGQSYVYDLAGNVTQDPNHEYTFDADERQSKIDNGVTGTYSYDGKGQRVKAVTSAGTALYVYDAGRRLIAEYTSGNVTGSGTSYLTLDTLGSPRVITDQNQSVKARHDYLPFGEEIPAGYGSRTVQQGYALDTVRQKFTGKERDIESGLDYFGSRYFSSPLGRFNSVDPLLASGRTSFPQSWNRYTYVLNNPLALVDPNGQDWYTRKEDGLNYWFNDAPTNNDQNHYTHLDIPASGLRVTNVQGATGQYSDLNSHNIILYNDASQPLVDAGPYVPFSEHIPDSGDVAYLLIQRAVEGQFILGFAVDKFDQQTSNPHVQGMPIDAGMPFTPVGVGGVSVGQAGAFRNLRRGIVGDSLSPHHMPQAALKFTGYAEGGALVVTQSEHVLTRTYGTAGRITADAERGLSFREVFARDIRDMRGIAGTKYNRGLLDLTNYYRTHFPQLMKK
jgi:RHS repeat-associated protein